MEQYNSDPVISKNVKKLLMAIIFIGIISVASGMMTMPQRVWSNILLNGIFLTGVGISGFMFIAIHYVSNSGWDVVIRKVPEAMSKIIPVGFVLMASVYFGLDILYRWSHPAIMESDTVLKGKEAWLNIPGFMIRMVIYFLFWYLIGKKIIKNSKKLENTGDLKYKNTARRWSAFWLYIGGIFFVAASFDWIMSLEPHWYSTIFGLYNFSGMFTSGISVIIILLIILKKKGLFSTYLKSDHLFELGRYLFSFTTFWVYIWFCQYMLIWYANMPEETVYFIKRNIGVFGSLTVLNVCLNWLFPFLILLLRKTKRQDKYLILAAVLVIIGRWTDLYLMIIPPNNKLPVFGLTEISIFLASISLFVWIFFRAFGKSSSVPENDPYLEESKSLHT